MTKVCVGCKRQLPETEFYKSKTGRPEGACKPCRSARARDRIVKLDSNRVIDWTAKSFCARCKTEKDAIDFGKSKATLSGLNSYCLACAKSYRLSRQVVVEEIPELKECNVCDAVKSSKDFHKSGSSKDGLKSKCKDCSRGADGLHVSRDKRLKNMYNISLKEYDDKLEYQGFNCAVCGISAEKCDAPLSVDHDHKCCPGKKSCGECVRGLLCTSCNIGLGYMKDDLKILEAAQTYIAKWIGRRGDKIG